MPVRKRLPQHRRVPQKSIADTDVSFDENIYLILQGLIDEAQQLDDPDTAELWLDAISDFTRKGNIEALLEACEWRRKVVPMEDFMFDPTYLGMGEAQTFPKVIEACVELDTGKYTEAVLKGALGTGKTTIGNIMLGRDVYKISCMRHPQTTFGIQAKSSIVFTIQSVRFNTAKKAVFEEFGQYLSNSSYFRHVYPYDRKVVSEMMFREQNIRIIPVTSSNTGVISMNVIGGVLDEMNFMQKIDKSKSSHADMDGSFDQAKNLYNTLARRRKTRFTHKGELPGTLFLISSSRYPDDFTEEKAAESTMEGGNDPRIYVYSHSQWSAKPRDTFMDEDFRVQLGNEQVRSKVLAIGEQAIAGSQVIDVPMDFYNEFVKDTEGSLRDYAGMTTLASRPFITRRAAIYECIETAKQYGYVNPFNLEEFDLSLGIPRPNTDKLRTDIDMFRTAHIDLGLKKDAAGIAVGHVAGTKIIERVNEKTGQVEIEILPVIGIDMALRVVPPPGGEIEFADIRKFLMTIRDVHKLDIKYVTFDGFQSVDSRQILKRHGFQTGYLSVEKIEAYRALRDAIYDGRLMLPSLNYVTKELAELEIVLTNNKEKVDHRPQGTKDVADAVCGVTNFLLKRRAAWADLRTYGKPGLHLLGSKGPIHASEDQLVTMDKPDRSKTKRRSIKRRSVDRR